MSDYVSMTAFAVAYDNVDDAEADSKAVKGLHYDRTHRYLRRRRSVQ